MYYGIRLWCYQNVQYICSFSLTHQKHLLPVVIYLDRVREHWWPGPGYSVRYSSPSGNRFRMYSVTTSLAKARISEGESSRSHMSGVSMISVTISSHHGAWSIRFTPAGSRSASIISASVGDRNEIMTGASGPEASRHTRSLR